MKTYTILYELDGRCFETTIDAWTKEQAKELFMENNPRCVIREIDET